MPAPLLCTGRAGRRLTAPLCPPPSLGPRSTMKRQLHQHVYLLVKQGSGWGFPRAPHQQGETIRFVHARWAAAAARARAAATPAAAAARARAAATCAAGRG